MITLEKKICWKNCWPLFLIPTIRLNKRKNDEFQVVYDGTLKWYEVQSDRKKNAHRFGPTRAFTNSEITFLFFLASSSLVCCCSCCCYSIPLENTKSRDSLWTAPLFLFLFFPPIWSCVCVCVTQVAFARFVFFSLVSRGGFLVVQWQVTRQWQ